MRALSPQTILQESKSREDQYRLIAEAILTYFDLHPGSLETRAMVQYTTALALGKKGRQSSRFFGPVRQVLESMGVCPAVRSGKYYYQNICLKTEFEPSRAELESLGLIHKPWG